MYERQITEQSMPFSIKKIEEHLTPFLHPSKHVLHCQNCYLHMCQDTGQLLSSKFLQEMKCPRKTITILHFPCKIWISIRPSHTMQLGSVQMRLADINSIFTCWNLYANLIPRLHALLIITSEEICSLRKPADSLLKEGRCIYTAHQ
jgi:hypothetical protein